MADSSAQEPRDLGALYRTHVRRVASWVARLAGPELDLEDTVQEVFITVRDLLPRFRGEASVTSWLYQVTARVVLRERRRSRWRRWLRGSAEETAGQLVSNRPTPVEELERREAVAELYRILDGLGEKYRTVFILYELEELSGQEIAELTGLKLKTVWVHLHRARQRFDEKVARLERLDRGRAEAVRLGWTGWQRGPR
jgi:RNA polymerase sigma-70 factor (ECF subfamily)